MSCPSILEFARLELLNHFSVPNLRQQKTHFADNFPISFQSYSPAIRFSKGFLEVDSFDLSFHKPNLSEIREVYDTI